METRATLEVIAATVEEAIEKGLQELNLPAEAVNVEVLDEGSRGLFGLGSRQARVRLTINPVRSSTVKKPASKPIQPETVEKEPEQTYRDASEQPPSLDVNETIPAPDANSIVEQNPEYALRITRETVFELLIRMDIQADLEVYFGETDSPNSRPPIWVDIQGNDLSVLIGRQAETLNALQYITSLIVGKELGHAVPLIVDVQGYRKRREQQLRQLARRMAEQAIKTGRRQVLEPMPSNERRLIHLELRQYQSVVTESIGEEPRRKVTIRPV